MKKRDAGRANGRINNEYDRHAWQFRWTLRRCSVGPDATIFTADGTL